MPHCFYTLSQKEASFNINH